MASNKYLPLHESWLTQEEIEQRKKTTPMTSFNDNSTTLPSTLTEAEVDAFHDAVQNIQPWNLIKDLNSNANTSTDSPSTDTNDITNNIYFYFKSVRLHN
jgi:hypothetical protein